MSGQIDPMIMQQILSMMRSQNADPFQRPLPGEGLLGMGGMSPDGGGFNQSLPHSAPMSAMPNDQQAAPNAEATIPTDFANTQPGLPNLPDTFTGFGFGQFAPKEYQPMGVRGQLIQQMMKHIGSGGAGGMTGGNGIPGIRGSFNGGMMGNGGMQTSMNGGF